MKNKTEQEGEIDIKSSHYCPLIYAYIYIIELIKLTCHCASHFEWEQV